MNHISHPVGEAVAFEDRRQAFETAMNGYSHRRGVKVVIAYDAMNRPADPVYVDIRTSSRYVRRVLLPMVLLSLSAAQAPCLLQRALHLASLCKPITARPRHMAFSTAGFCAGSSVDYVQGRASCLELH